MDSVEDRNAKPVAENIWIPALVFTSACLVFLFIAFFLRTLSPDQRRILNAIFPLLSGFATFFLGGTAFVRLTGGLGGIKFLFTGTAGVAVFVFVFLHPIFTNDSRDPSPSSGIGTHSPSGDRVKFDVSGAFDLGYSISPGSWVIIDTRTGAQIAANITIVGPDDKKDVFSNQAVYQTSTTWGWQGQGSSGGSLDFTDQNPFVRYPGGVLSHSAYNNPSLGHIITSSNTTLTPAPSPDSSR